MTQTESKAKERPIIFSGEMVRAILEGRKTQTRRAWKEPEPLSDGYEWCFHETKDGEWELGASHPNGDGSFHSYIRCPCGVPGDRLWVRETFALENTSDYEGDPDIDPPEGPVMWRDEGRYRVIPRYRATAPETNLIIADDADDDDAMRWTPSIFMPRWASRLTLAVTGVRVEPLQEISRMDALAEGIERHPDSPYHKDRDYERDTFRALWDSINAKRPGCSWKDDPFVWVIDFEVLQ